ncbi:MAG TPA: DegT/DnrJ/EryC1/StrS family aminotransferase [Terriglobales bacterium]|nr:DegT/DnrJ/EryC1/StrS family aminotransferase [Terriglobales bacterium]
MANTSAEVSRTASIGALSAPSPLPLPTEADASGRDLGDDELALLAEVIRSGVLNCTKGTQVNQFEREFAELYDVAHARAVASGTAAVHTAIAAIDPDPGDEIITTSVTDMGAIAPILYQRAVPVFADVDPISLNITPRAVAERITSRTKAIIVTHLFGNPADIHQIARIAADHGIPVIEDCAQAYLARAGGCRVGTIGQIGAFSLQQGKHMTTGEGGVVITDAAALARRIRLFSDKAWGYGDPDPDHYFLALNYRMSELHGAVARAQLNKLDWVVARRQQTAEQLTRLLTGTPGLTLPQPLPGATHVYWKYPLTVDPEQIEGGADALGQALQKRGIHSAPRYIKKPAFECRLFTERKTFGSSGCPLTCSHDRGPIHYDASEYPGTIEGLRRVVVLPWNEFYTDAHVDFIASSVQDAVDSLTRP